MDCEVKFTEVKQARYVKPEVTRSRIYISTLSMSMLRPAARVYGKKTGFSVFLKIHKKIAFYPNRKIFRRSSLHEI